MKLKYIWVVVAPVIVYLLFAFGNWCFNPGVWDPAVRAMCSVFLLAVSLIAGAAVTLPKEDNN